MFKDGYFSVISCQTLRPISHGKWIIPDLRLLPGTNALLECQAGYHVNGDATVTCTSSGERESFVYLRVCLPDISSSGISLHWVQNLALMSIYMFN
ncbi:hypothetical protein DPMN_061950 [Dreissena polymorpha]|uniref:Sushi domain-containing protein n=1 Tax=Dreissena polymorpha TaxID=45954 RepID=A0A9D4HIV7_DREPO|nr:hypothetical protein DPMN_061950 [Dreissena polymorpha]